MSQPDVSPAWASTALGDLLCGPLQCTVVRASTRSASYLSVPGSAATPSAMALLSEEAVRLPIGVVLATGELPDSGVTVRIGEGMIATGGHIWRIVRWWDPRPQVRVDALVAHGSELLELLMAQATSSYGLPLARALAVARALANGDAGPALEVIGLGPGLTPAGDDVVAGALAVLALTGRLDERAREAIITCASTRTTTLSAALVAAAGQGQVIPQAASLLSALAAGTTSEKLRSAANPLFAVGATSGHDLCSGMAGALAAAAFKTAPELDSELAMATWRPI